MQTAWTLCICTWVEFSKWDSSIQCNSNFLCQVSICNLFLSNGWSMPVPSFNHCSHWWGYFQLPVTARNAVKTSRLNQSGCVPHLTPWIHLITSDAGGHPATDDKADFFYEKLCTIFLSVQLPYLLDWKLSYPFLLGLQTLDFQQPCASLQTQLNPNCPLHLGKDTSSPTEAVADLWTNWSHWFNKLCSSPVFPNIPFVTLPFPYDIFRPPVPHPCHP